MRNRIDWADERLGPNVYEDMVSVLISRLHTQAQRIDGSGGDGGRDVLLPLPTGLEIFELKSFTGRLSAGTRRAQVKRSLERAATHSPVSWHLVVPIDPTSRELDWFEQLTADYPFPCDWRGKTWLDSQMAAHTDIRRYYLEGSAEEINDVLRELSREQANLSGGLPDLTGRLQALAARLNNLDPHYTFGFAVELDGSTRITIRQQYPGAELDRPTLLGASFQFPDTELGRQAAAAFQDTVDYGTPSVIPGQYVQRATLDAPAGLGGEFEGATLKFTVPLDVAAEDLRMTLRVLEDDGETVAQLPLRGVVRSGGQRGTEIAFTDLCGVLRVTTRFDKVDHRFHLSYHFAPKDECLPAMILPAMLFAAEIHGDRGLLTLINDAEVGPPITLDQTVSDIFLSQLNTIEMLDSIQHTTGVYFAVPQSISPAELADIREVHRLLDGEVLVTKWDRLKVTMPADSPIAAALQGQEAREITNLYRSSELVLQLGTQAYPVGQVRQTVRTATLVTLEDVLDDTELEGSVRITFTPGDDPTMETRLIAPDELAP